MSLQKESEWEKRFEEKFPQKLVEFGDYYEVEYGNEIKSFIREEITTAISTREKEIAEEVEGRKSKPSYGAYTTQDAKVFWEGKDAAFDEVLQILKH